MPVNPADIEKCKKLMEAWEGNFIINEEGNNAEWVANTPTKLLGTVESQRALMAQYVGNDDKPGIQIDMYAIDTKELCKILAEHHGTNAYVCNGVDVIFRFYPCKSTRWQILNAWKLTVLVVADYCKGITNGIKDVEMLKFR